MASWFDDNYFLGNDREMHRRDYETTARWFPEDEHRIIPDRPRERFHQSGAEWVAWHRGSRWCRRCRQDVPHGEDSCPMCGDPAYGRVE